MAWQIWIMALGGCALPAAPLPPGQPAEVAPAPTAVPPEQTAGRPLTEEEVMALGEVGYGKWCATCHQADGFGVRSVYPPLVGQAAWMASCEQHAGYVVHGLFGPIEVGGEVYDQLMPPLERSVDDVEVAAILTFVQNSWGNRYGACSPEAVVRAREAARPGPVAAGTSGSPTPSP